jgi:hypothetical protein
MAVSVLDVIDNFTGPSSLDLRTAPGTVLEELGEHVRASAAAAERSGPLEPGTVYLGGWPSANFWAVGGDLLLSSLLYSPAVLVRDPISDWFSNEQYRVRHKMPARPGYLDGDGRPNIAATRAFLANVLPQLEEWRPLIEAGVVVLTTAEDHALADKAAIEDLQGRLEVALLTDPVAYAHQFRPTEIAVEDNVRGSFVFAGGEQVSQLKRAQSDGIYHFAREYILASHHGATYTAPFRHERYLCREGLGRVASPANQVVEALLRSELPILSGLTPSIIGKVHDDDGFASFRERLHLVYSQVPVGESDEHIRRYLQEQESALLEPSLKQAEKSAERGPMGRLGVTLTENAFALATAVATGLILRDPLAATGVAVLGTAAQGIVSRHAGTQQHPQRIWTALTKHQRSARDEMRGVEVSNTGAPGRPWGIPEEPSMDVTISEGELLIDHFSTTQVPSVQTEGYVEGPYRRCACGSGLKYKFCCKSLDDAWR